MMFPANPSADRLRRELEESQRQFMKSGGNVVRLNWAGDPTDADPHFPEVVLAVPVQYNIAKDVRKPVAVRKQAVRRKPPVTRKAVKPLTFGDVLENLETMSHAEFSRKAASIQRRADQLRAELASYAKELRRRAQASAKAAS